MPVISSAEQPVRSTPRDLAAWNDAVEEHRAALAAFLDAAERLRDDEWTQPWAPGKWTRAEIAEHLALAYEAVIHEVTGGEPMKAKLSPMRQRVTRWLILPHILFHRSFPIRARSPRETRPQGGRPLAEALKRMRTLGERFEQEMERARPLGGGHLTHPYFGRVEPVKAMRFVAVHIEHHTRQIAVKR